MVVRKDYWTGSIAHVRESLVRSVGQYIRYNSKVKVGITNNPSRRATEHARDKIGWSTMVVKYKTSSVNFVNQLERELIDHHFDYIANEAPGGGGPNAASGPYFLYVLLK